MKKVIEIYIQNVVYCIGHKYTCFSEVNSLSNKTFYIVDSEALPEVFKKVIETKDLIENGTAKNTSEAISFSGISRSAFYKYKDSVFKATESDSDSIELQAVLVDRAGVFSALSNALFKSGANIITMNQTAPENGLAAVSIVIGIDSLKAPVHELIKNLELIDGVVSIKNV